MLRRLYESHRRRAHRARLLSNHLETLEPKLLLAADLAAVGATFEWTGQGATDVWSDAANWAYVSGTDTGVAGRPDLDSGDTLIFGDAVGLDVSSLSNTNDLGAGCFAAINVMRDGYTLSGDLVTLTDGVTANFSSGTSTIGLVLGGVDATLTKAGAGTLVLTGANTFTGRVDLSGGTLALSGGDDRLPTDAEIWFTGNGSSSTLDVGTTDQTVSRVHAGVGETESVTGTFLSSGTGTLTVSDLMNQSIRSFVTWNLHGNLVATQFNTATTAGGNRGAGSSSTINALDGSVTNITSFFGAEVGRNFVNSTTTLNIDAGALVTVDTMQISRSGFNNFASSVTDINVSGELNVTNLNGWNSNNSGGANNNHRRVTVLDGGVLNATTIDLSQQGDNNSNYHPTLTLHDGSLLTAETIILDRNHARVFSTVNWYGGTIANQPGTDLTIHDGIDAFNLQEAQISSFTGSDPGEGLDLQGDFLYAVNARGPAVGMIGDADFTTDSVAGVTTTAEHEALTWVNPNFDDGDGGTRAGAEGALETVLSSIRWSSNPEDVVFDVSMDIETGATYKLQLLFAEGCCNRGFDVSVDGTLIADDFSPRAVTGVSTSPTQGTVLTHTFMAGNDTLSIVLDGSDTPFPDKNPVIQGFTLEKITSAELLAHDFDIEEGQTATVNQAIAGDGSFTKNGGGALILPAANTYSGMTTVNDGKVYVNASTDNSDFVVNSGGTLGGAGGTVGHIDLNGTGLLAPGASPGTLSSTGGATLDEGTLVFELNDGADVDHFDVTGGDVVLGTALDLSTAPDFTAEPGQVFALVNNTGPGTLTGTFAGLADGDVVTTAHGDSFQVRYNYDLATMAPGIGNDVVVVSHNLAPTVADDAFSTDEDTPLSSSDVATAADYTNAVLADNPAIYWKLDDTSGTTVVNQGNLGPGGDGAYVNGPLLDVPGAFDASNNRAVEFNLTNDHAVTSAAAIPAAVLSDNRFSVEIWFNTDATRQQDLLALSHGNSHDVLLELQSNDRVRYLHRSTGEANIFSNVNYTPGAWHHVVATMDDGNMTLYLDGVEVGRAVHANPTTVDTTLTIGQLLPNNTARQFDGRLDEVAIYDRALSPAEIRRHRQIAHGSLLANDTDPEGDVLSVVEHDAVSAMGAAVTVDPNGTFHYDPTGSAVLNALATGETAVDTFRYTISDSGTEQFVDTATVAVTVTGVNDMPVITGHDDGAVIEDASATATETDSGVIRFGDVDLTDTHLASAEFSATTHPGGQLGQLTASVTADTNPLTTDFGILSLQGWTVLHGGAHLRGADGGGLNAAISSTDNAFGFDFVHENFVVQSPQDFTIGDATVDGTHALIVEFAGGAGNQPGSVAPFANPIEVINYNGGMSDSNGLKGLAFYNTATMQYDATFFDPNNGGIDTLSFTSAQLESAGVDLSATYRLHYYDNDQGGWGWTQLNSVQVASLGGEITWDYQIDNTAIQFLAAGETITETYRTTVTENLLADNFDDNSLDLTKWNVVTAGIRQPGASVTETGGRIQFVGRGHLNTVDHFNPSEGGIRITGVWEYGDDDFMQVLTRSSGAPSGRFGETSAGIEFFSYTRDNSFNIWGRGGAAVTSSGPVSLPQGLNPGELYAFELTDDGFNLTATLTEIENPANTATVTATSDYVSPTNLVTFHNRENGRTAFLDDVLIENFEVQSDYVDIDVVIAGVNDAPTVQIDNATVTVVEADTATNAGVFNDVDLSDDVTVTASIGTIIQDAGISGAWSWEWDTTDGPDESQTVTITATDSQGISVAQTFELLVENAAPTASLDGPAAGAQGVLVELTGEVSDPGDDLLTATWKVYDPDGAEFASGAGTDIQFTPQSEGTFVAELTVVDDEGAWGIAQHEVLVVKAGVVPGPDGTRILMLAGSEGRDIIHVNRLGFRSTILSVSMLEVRERRFTKLTITEPIDAIMAYGLSGNDHMWISPRIDIDTMLDGGAGNDRLESRAGNDLLRGGPGNDHLIGGPGNDILEGGDGRDKLVGGDGNDLLIGGEGNDSLEGGRGDDVLLGQAGADWLFGQLGDDRLDGGTGNDKLDGGRGDDILRGGEGNDRLRGRAGNDQLFGEAGRDALFGDLGNDLLHGGPGNDRLRGGPGNDQLFGEEDDDTLFGGRGIDLLDGGAGNNRIWDF